MKHNEKEGALSLYLKSILIGSGVVIPGISAGTVAFFLGIYDLILRSITKLPSREFCESTRILFWVGLGALTGIALFVALMSTLILPYTAVTIFTFSLFSGFILSSVILVRRMIPHKIESLTKLFARLALALGFVLILGIFLYSPSKGELTDTYTTAELTNPSFLITLGAAHFMTGGFMLMPGISGSAILLSWGLYAPTLVILKQVLILPILVIALGNLVGIFFWSGLIHSLLKHHTILTLFLIIGLILGSTVQVFWQALSLVDGSSLNTLWAILGFVAGAGASLPFNRQTKD